MLYIKSEFMSINIVYTTDHHFNVDPPLNLPFDHDSVRKLKVSLESLQLLELTKPDLSLIY